VEVVERAQTPAWSVLWLTDGEKDGIAHHCLDGHRRSSTETPLLVGPFP
jgi:hypothetical protein